MLGQVKNWWSRQREADEAEFHSRLHDLRRHNRAPLFWLFGKTQSGKTSLVKFLTGADDAEIGHGFQPCTRFSRIYEFPTVEAPILRFLDTRGVDEPGYDPEIDLDSFGRQAHVVIVTVKALDHAQENVLRHLRKIRNAKATRPIVLILSCLHEAYPQQQHPPYPFRLYSAAEPLTVGYECGVARDLVRSLEEQRRRFAAVVDFVLPLDLTRPEEGFDDPNYGGRILHDALLHVLPAAQRQTMEAFEAATQNVRDLHARSMLPTIVGYSALAASAGAVPLPFVAIMLLPMIQRRMIRRLAEQSGRPESAARFLEMADQLGLGKMRRHLQVELLKVVPYLGIPSAAALAGHATYALGRAFAHFDAELSHGVTIDSAELQRYYQEQLDRARATWNQRDEQAMKDTS